MTDDLKRLRALRLRLAEAGGWPRGYHDTWGGRPRCGRIADLDEERVRTRPAHGRFDRLEDS